MSKKTYLHKCIHLIWYDINIKTGWVHYPCLEKMYQCSEKYLSVISKLQFFNCSPLYDNSSIPRGQVMLSVRENDAKAIASQQYQKLHMKTTNKKNGLTFYGVYCVPYTLLTAVHLLIHIPQIKSVWYILLSSLYYRWKK